MSARGNRRRIAPGALVAGLLLAGCGSDGAGSKVAHGGSGWNAVDACATLGRERAAAIGGAAVTGARLDAISAGGNGLAAASMCTFVYANGATLMLVTREAPDADATATAIEAARTGGGLTPPADPVAGLGKAAFWSVTGKQAQLFLDDRRYAVINFFKLPAGEDAKARSLAVAKALL